MTILPGHPIPPPDAPPPPPAPAARGPRVNASRRTVAAVVAGAVVLGGGGAWFALHSSGGASPAAAVTTKSPVHHPAKAAKPSAPHTRAAAMAAATQVFTVLPAQLPGWQVEGKPTFFTGDDGSDPVGRAAAGCLAAASGGGIGVNSPSLLHRTATPTYLGVDVMLAFMRTPARAAADLAVLGRPSAQKCLAHALVGRTVSVGAGSTLRYTSMKSLRLPAHTVGFEFDGQIESNVIGGQAVRVVMLATVDRATEILVTSTGLGAALPLGSDVRILNAIRAQAHRVVG
jgi:hypothetical protein